MVGGRGRVYIYSNADIRAVVFSVSFFLLKVDSWMGVREIMTTDDRGRIRSGCVSGEVKLFAGRRLQVPLAAGTGERGITETGTEKFAGCSTKESNRLAGS
ncbi:hypothetical protein QC761_0098710 [Podospora bellae-mahoneyi]|uniref:Uncharacterized protein n=1 Tax=Podospora bellae-mahoneyi TaxID=2093777 RepID=A0ABR0FCH2_9PEZI|nr:hypothetical protein QC761_0098710 [Podospora bellae-mahoneyi]